MTLLVAALCALAAWLWVAPSGNARLRTLFVTEQRERESPVWLVPLALIVFGVGMTIALGSVLGIVLSVIAAIAFPRVMRRMSERPVQARRDLLRRQAPQAADLLAATLASGAPMMRSIAVVAAAVDPPMREVLTSVSTALELGATPHEAWRLADADGTLNDISAGFDRAMRSGAPLASVLVGVAGDLRRGHRQAVEVDARVAGVRAIAPLAACFLPAFLLVGAVPIVASFATGLFD